MIGMKHHITRRSNLHTRIIAIVNNVVNILNLHYLQNLVGMTFARHLIIYVIGLIILDAKPTMTRISNCLKCCYHDGLYKMLSNMNLTMKALSRILVSFIERFRRPKVKGWLIIDDTSIAKKFAKKIKVSGIAWCGCIGKVANSIHFVTLYWTDGRWGFPVGFRLWTPRKSSSGKLRKHYRSRVELARELVVENIDFCNTCEYITFDTWYCGGKFLRLMRHLKIHIVSSLRSNRNVIFKKRKMKVSDFSVGFRGVVTLPGYGDVFIYVSKLGHHRRCLMSSDKRVKYRKLRKRYKRRWPVEEFFRILKQNLGLCGCQCRKPAAVVNHVSIVFLAYVVLEVLRFRYGVSHGKIKSMIQDKFYGNNEKIAPLKVRRDIFKHAA